MIVPGGGLSLDGRRWISSRPAFLLPVRVLSELFRRLFLTGQAELHADVRPVHAVGSLRGQDDATACRDDRSLESRYRKAHSQREVTRPARRQQDDNSSARTTLLTEQRLCYHPDHASRT